MSRYGDDRFSDRPRSNGRRRDRDDDDDRDERPRPSGDSGVTSAIVILGIIGAVVLGIVLVCGGLGLFAMITADRARQDMQKMMDEEMKRQHDLLDKQKNAPPPIAPAPPPPNKN
jgi:hypothetical protein